MAIKIKVVLIAIALAGILYPLSYQVINCMQNNHIYSADSIRGLACIAVLLSHCVLAFFPVMHGIPEISRDIRYNPYLLSVLNSPFTFFYSGGAAVYIFFVLSGIVLSKSYGKSQIRLANLPFVFIKRYVRLMIPCMASVLLSYFILKHVQVDTSHASLWIDKFGKDDYSFLSALRESFYGVFFDSGFSKYNWVLWTMRIEFAGSVALMIIYMLSHKYQSIAKCTSMFFSLIVFFLINHDPIYLGVSLFMAGSLMAQVNLRISGKASLFMCMSGLYLAGYHYNSLSYDFISGDVPESMQYVIQDIAYAISGVLICTALTGYEWKWLARKEGVINFFGRISFSLYLTHLLLLYVIGVGTFNYLSHHGNSYLLSSLTAIAATIVSSIAVSAVFYRLFDTTSVKMARRIGSVRCKV